MADLVVEGRELVLYLSSLEKFAARSTDLRVPLASLRGIEVLNDPLAVMTQESEAQGMSLPGIVAVGRFHRNGAKVFAAVHHFIPRGVRVCLEDYRYDEVVVSCIEPEKLARQLRCQR